MGQMLRFVPLLLVWSCATARQPLPLAGSEGVIREAGALGANQVPTARLHLQHANQQLELARSLELAGDARAELALSIARADADLALALAQEAAVRRERLRTARELASLRSRP